MLCLKSALKATMYQKKFWDLLLHPSAKAAIVDIKNDSSWKEIYFVLQGVYPALLALQRCDTSQPSMSKNLVNRASCAIEKSILFLNDDNIFGFLCHSGEDDLSYEQEMVFGDDYEDDSNDKYVLHFFIFLSLLLINWFTFYLSAACQLNLIVTTMMIVYATIKSTPWRKISNTVGQEKTPPLAWVCHHWFEFVCYS